MDSETMEPRERPERGDNCKVYTRRNRKKAPDNKCNAENATVSATTNMYTSPENRINNHETKKDSDTVPQKFSQTLATEEPNSSQQQQSQPASDIYSREASCCYCTK